MRAAAITTTIHAPSENLASAVTTITSPVVVAPSPLISAFGRHPAGRRVSQRRTMPTCDSVNEVNTPRAYSGIRSMRAPVEEGDQAGRGEPEDDDPVREDEPVAPARELPGQEPVARHEGRQPGEVRERGVGGEGQDHHRDTLDEVVEQAAPEDLRGRAGRPRSPRSCGTIW